MITTKAWIAAAGIRTLRAGCHRNADWRGPSSATSAAPIAVNAPLGATMTELEINDEYFRAKAELDAANDVCCPRSRPVSRCRETGKRGF